MSVLQSLRELRPPIRILIVADGVVHFRNQGNGFSLEQLLSILCSAGNDLWSKVDITTARRIDDDPDCKCTCNVPFRFDSDFFRKGDFDEVWLFGAMTEHETGLDDSEVEAILQYMNAGGGVFATGDHESLGAAMSGRLPRVGSMRKWFFDEAPSAELKAPGRNDETRLDTLREGPDLGFDLDDESDRVAQEIRPKFFSKCGGEGSAPHFLLTDCRGFAITVMPDHMHEGECIVPDNLERTFKLGEERVDEYPPVPDSDPEIRTAPQVVAISTSAAGFMVGKTGNHPPVEPRSFVSIVAYAGDEVGVGRVAVDSSFHHFLDLNLVGIDSFRSSKGFIDCEGKPRKEYEAIAQYYRNLLHWLGPADLRSRMYQALLVDLRFNTSLIEELSPIPAPTLRDYLLVGVVTRSAIAARFCDAEAVYCCLGLISELPAKTRRVIESLIHPCGSLPEDLSGFVVNQNLIVNAVLGVAMLTVVNDLPPSPAGTLLKLSGSQLSPSSMLSRLVTRGLHQVLPTLSPVFEVSGMAMSNLSRAFLELSLGDHVESRESDDLGLIAKSKEVLEMACRTNVGDFWDSWVPRGRREGSFEITSLDSSGHFEGVFGPGQQRIAGECTGNTISFDRPATSPQFHYEGEFVSNDRIRGTRRQAVRARGEAPPPDEEWEGTKVT